MEFLKNLFAESPLVSWLRVNGTFVIVNGLAICWYGAVNSNEVAMLGGTGLVSLALIGKVTQKIVEK